jgi:hypothetical protein
MNQQIPLELDIHLTECAARIADVLRNADGWMRMTQLSAITGIREREIRQLIVEVLRPKGIAVISGRQGYKIAATTEETEQSAAWMKARAITGIRNYATMRGVSLGKALNEIRNHIVGEVLS